MPPLLVIGRTPETSPALPRIVPQVSHSLINSNFYHLPNGKKVANTMKSPSARMETYTVATVIPFHTGNYSGSAKVCDPQLDRQRYRLPIKAYPTT
jgi:hypothetical protein